MDGQRRSHEISQPSVSQEVILEADATTRGQRVPYFFDAHKPEEWGLVAYLFNQSNETIPDPASDTLTPDNFYKLLCTTLHVDDETVALTAINRFAGLAEAEYKDIDEPTVEETNLLQSIEVEISKFIESNQKIHRLSVLGPREAQALSQIYNAPSLLAFAVEGARRQSGGITAETLEVIYRYRTVVCRIQEVMDHATDLAGETPNHKMSNREMGWAGDVHEYGYDNSNRINTRDFRTFGGVDEEEIRVVNVQGVDLKLLVGRRFDE